MPTQSPTYARLPFKSNNPTREGSPPPGLRTRRDREMVSRFMRTEAWVDEVKGMGRCGGILRAQRDIGGEEDPGKFL